MEKELISRITKSYFHKNYEAAIFQINFLTLKYKDMILAICYYEINNFYKALTLLKKYNTHTSKFYEGLCYKSQKNYVKAIESFLDIVENRTIEDEVMNNGFDRFMISDYVYIHELLGECYTCNREREKGLEHYKCAFKIYPLLKSFENLISENIAIKIKRLDLLETNYFADIITHYKNDDDKEIKKYKKLVPGIGSYFLSECARRYGEKSYTTNCILLFDFLRKKDPHFINNLDTYSTILWFGEDSSKLSILCKDLVKYHSNSYITWTALGNYFSQKNDNQRAITCFERSSYIQLNHYALSLLGHESIIRGEYKNAMKYFHHSIDIYKNNYNANFAVGIVYENSGKYENAEVFFKKGFYINPHNTTLRSVFLQYYIKIKEYKKALNLLGIIYKIDDDEILNVFNVIKNKQINEEDEKIILYFVEILIHYDLAIQADELMKILKVRNSDYFYRREIVDEKLSSVI